MQKHIFRLTFLIIPFLSLALLLGFHILYNNETIEIAISKAAIMVVMYYIAASFIWSFYSEKIRQHFN